MKTVSTINYVHISIFFTSLLLILFIGFYRTYIVFFPTFKGFRIEQHFHGMMMLLWMMMLIIQPLLIRMKANKLHRIMGKISLIIAPLLIISIFLVSRMVYKRNISQSVEEALAMMALSVPAMLAFATIYYLAIFNSQNMKKHMRYMIGTSFLMLGPGLGRFLIVGAALPFDFAVNFVNWLTVGLALVFLVYDIRKKNNYLPYLNVFMITVILALLWIFRYNDIWQVPARFFADVLF